MKDKIQRWIFKAMMVLFATALALGLTAQVLRTVSTLQLVVAGTVVSLMAYVIRERRIGRQRRPRNGSAGERTPVMPRMRP